MNELEIIRNCVNLVWNYGELYDGDDIEEFQHEHFHMWPDKHKVTEYLDNLEKIEWKITYKGVDDGRVG